MRRGSFGFYRNEIYNKYLDPDFKFSGTPTESCENLYNDVLSFVFTDHNNALTRDHLLLLGSIFKKIADTQEVKFSPKEKSMIYVMTLINYTLSKKDRALILQKLTISHKRYKGRALKEMLISCGGMNHKVRRSVIREIVESHVFEKESASLIPSVEVFDFPIIEHSFSGKATPSSQWCLNNLVAYSYFKKKYPKADARVSGRYKTYLANYQIPWVRRKFESEGIVNSSFFLKEYVPNLSGPKVPISQYSVWNSGFDSMFSSPESFNMFCRDHSQYILDTFKQHHQLLETMEGFKDPVKARDCVVSIRGLIFIRDNSFPWNKPIKEGMKEIFGFNSAKLVHYLSDYSTKVSGSDFVLKICFGKLIKNWVSQESTDLKWKWLMLKLPGSSLSLFDNSRIKSRVESIFSQEQYYKLWENSLNFEDSSLSENQNLSELFIKAQDSLSMIGEVGDYIKTLTFSEINTFDKLHDICSREYSRIKNKLENLELETKYPSLKDMDKSLSQDFSLVIPQTNHDLIYWGQSLKICVGSYVSKVKGGHSLVVGVEKNGKISYCLEIGRGRNGKMVNIQFKGLRNSQGPDSMVQEIFEKICPIMEQEFMLYDPYQVSGDPDYIQAEGFIFPRAMFRAEPLPDIDIDQDDHNEG